MYTRSDVITTTLIGLLCIAILPVHGQETDAKVCTGPYKGQTVSAEQLDTVLRQHAEWRKQPNAPNAKRANLCGANLREANLSRLNLSKVDLRQANLRGAVLTQATMSRVDLTEADLLGAKLSGANLVRATLRKAILDQADLSNSLLNKANLQEAVLRRANLTGAKLDEVNLGKADLREANVTSVLYEPAPESLPIITYMARAEHLSRLTFQFAPQGLIELREAFKKAGLRRQEREVTYAINYAQRINTQSAGNTLESLFKYLLFELTCDYGMRPERPLIILSLLLPLFAIVYMISLNSCGRAGIWVVWESDRVSRDEGDDAPRRITGTFYFPTLQARAAGHWWHRFLRLGCVLLIGLHYSALSAFRIGWQQVNIAAWINLMEPREYHLKATGWVKLLSGMQSLIGGYMVALWILTYFGRPFNE